MLDSTDYLAAPDDGKRYEILCGDLLVTPAPSPLHQRVSWRLERVLDEHFRTRAGNREARFVRRDTEQARWPGDPARRYIDREPRRCAMCRSCAVVVVLLLLLTCACHEADDMGSPVPAGAMSYSGFDAAGRLVVVGWIRLDVVTIFAQPGVSTPQEFTGDWSLRALVDPSVVGPQSGTGKLAGTFVEDGVSVDLNPGSADDNVVLFGALTAGGPARARYEGTWSWVTLAGVKVEGTFQAME